MPSLSSSSHTDQTAASRPLVISLFFASCLLSVVSWYTTQQGMALYLSPWFSVLASLGVQSALVLVAWLIGFTQTRRAILVAVYVVTASVSIGFSYVSLYTWFTARERPAAVERRLYDALATAAGRSQELVTTALAEGQKHVLALDEMTTAEKSHGYISRAQDVDPYLARVREAVAREASTYAAAYTEGAGAGLRYTAFDRYAKLARQSVERLAAAQRALTAYRSRAQPLEATDGQLRTFRQTFDAIPWADVREALHDERLVVPTAPAYSDFVDRSATGQEELLLAVGELFTAPNSRHVLALTLAAFIDIIVFLLAYASGPFFFGAPEERWLAAAAALDGHTRPLFLRGLLHKLGPDRHGRASLRAGALSGGERQLLLLLVGRGLAAPLEEDGELCYLIDMSFHQQLVESLANGGVALRAAATAAHAEPAHG